MFPVTVNVTLTWGLMFFFYLNWQIRFKTRFRIRIYENIAKIIVLFNTLQFSQILRSKSWIWLEIGCDNGSLNRFIIDYLIVRFNVFVGVKCCGIYRSPRSRVGIELIVPWTLPPTEQKWMFVSRRCINLLHYLYLALMFLWWCVVVFLDSEIYFYCDYIFLSPCERSKWAKRNLRSE